jgi:PKD repeat protein
MIQAASVGIPGSGVVIQVGDGFITNLLIETYWGGWKPALYVFDNENTPVSWGGKVLTNFTSAFYYTDVPVSGLTATNDSPTKLGNSTTLTATVTGGTNISYNWDFGDSTGGTGKFTGHTYSNPGYYTAKVFATNEAGTSFAETLVYVYLSRVYLPIIMR